MARQKRTTVKNRLDDDTESEEKETRLSAKSRYTQLATEREPYLRRARECASYTIPALMPPLGSTGATELPTPFQGVGARGTNNLASKLLLAVFPPGGSFFRLTIDDFVLDMLAQRAAKKGIKVEDARAEFETALGKVERAVITRLEQKGTRLAIFELFKQLVNSGNGLIQVLPDSRLKLHKLCNYVVKRDGEGKEREIIVLQLIDRLSLTGEARAIAERIAAHETSDDKKNNIEVYTWIRRESDEWTVHQEVGGQIVTDTQGSYPLEKTPWLPQRFIAVDGEDYGRGYSEEYLGDLRSLESLTQSIVEGSAAAAKVLFFCQEGGVTSKEKIQNAPNGAIIDGSAKDISTLQLEKFADFQVAKGTADTIEKRLKEAFLLLNVRDAERVTAEEIRMLAQELEQALGGVYSVLAQELQRPLAVRVMAQMQREGKLPHLPDKAVSPQIVTGLEGLGRTSDLAKLDTLITGVAQELGPEAVSEYVNAGALIKRRAAALNIDVNGLIRTEDEVSQIQKQKQQAEAINKLGPHAIKAMSDNAIAARQQQAPDNQNQ